MALTDINTGGIYDFIKECKAVAIKPLVGIEFRYNNKLLYIIKTQQALRK
jgi:DNA polymerase-3 subunit alpha/error-prone DNA polymerase